MDFQKYFTPKINVLLYSISTTVLKSPSQGTTSHVRHTGSAENPWSAILNRLCLPSVADIGPSSRGALPRLRLGGKHLSQMLATDSWEMKRQQVQILGTTQEHTSSRTPKYMGDGILQELSRASRPSVLWEPPSCCSPLSIQDTVSLESYSCKNSLCKTEIKCWCLCAQVKQIPLWLCCFTKFIWGLGSGWI